ncbi:MAG TPA: tetratricopeptide repeat protein [Blastocatellia bacterium]|nr:tetratricopeptide repeat protein [Blastocatellia bacterium]
MSDEEDTDDWLGVDQAAGIIRAYERALRFKPREAQMHFDYGIAFLELGIGFESQAIEAFKTAARLCPSWSAVHLQVGLAYASANRREEALDSYKRALALQPDDTNALAALAHTSLLLGCYKEAEEAATRIIEVAPLASVPHLILGVAHLLQSRYADADESLRRAISLESDLAEAHYGIGLAAIILGNDSVVQIQHERLRELDCKLAEKLMEHREREAFTPAELLNCIFETDADVRTDKR